MIALTLSSYVIGPLLIVTIIRRVPQLSGINPIIPAYILGLALSTVVPHTQELAATQEAISSAMVALSIPLMLFSVNLRKWPIAGRRALLSLGLAVTSIVAAVTVGTSCSVARSPRAPIWRGLWWGYIPEEPQISLRSAPLWTSILRCTSPFTR